MELKMGEIIAFGRIYNTLSQQEMPLSAAFKLNRIAKTCNEHIEFYQQKYQEYLNIYCELDENGNPKMNEQGYMQIKDGMIQECEQKMQELLDLPIEINCSKIKLEQLENLNINLIDMNILASFIEE